VIWASTFLQVGDRDRRKMYRELAVGLAKDGDVAATTLPAEARKGT
jgi:hypothetical protein